jgi:5'-nucleotidase/UDP-sugar diphosphatase
MKKNKIKIVSIISIILTIVSVIAYITYYNFTNFSVTVFSTNDIHGNFDVLSHYSTVVNSTRKTVSNVLLVDAGDFFKGGIYERFQGKLELEIYNKMGYDALTLGNNEYDVPPYILQNNSNGFFENSKGQIKNITGWAEFPVLNANVKIIKTSKSDSDVLPYIIKKIGFLNIAIIGLGIRDNNDSFRESNDSVATLKELLPVVKKISDIQIVVSHDNMTEIMHYEGISAIMSGHNHIATSEPSTTIVGNAPIMQGGGKETSYLSQLDLKYKHENGKWVLKSFVGKLNSPNDFISDEKIVAIIDKYKQLTGN